MPFLSTDKVLVILVVALVVLGPNKLPQVARQIGSLWSEFQRFRQRIESEVRGTFPDLPSTETLTRAVRSPLSMLEDLAATNEGPTTALDQGQGAEAPAAVTANGDGPGAEPGA
ncbi:MAG: twin-arginine translocase TatA/TatE family subunit, partial [Acidimicrobiales bacterium]